MVIKTSAGTFSQEEFVERCNNRSLPRNLTIDSSLEITHNHELRELPNGLRVNGYLSLEGCTSIESLPESLIVDWDLLLRDCISLTGIPTGTKFSGSLHLKNCISLKTLPKKLYVKTYADFCGCTELTELPSDLTVGNILHIERCPNLRKLPAKLKVQVLIIADRPFVEGLPFQDLPKYLHLPFEKQIKKFIKERLKDDCPD